MVTFKAWVEYNTNIFYSIIKFFSWYFLQFYKMVTENIKQIAKDKGVTLSDLAAKIDMTESGMYAMFRNNSIKISTLEKISEVLNVSILSFFEETISMASEPQVKYNTELDRCRSELELWKQKAFENLEKYNRLLEKEIQDRNRQTG